MSRLIYVMDPMCSWCYAFSPTLESLIEEHPDLKIEYIMGGLAPDSDKPMAEEMQQKLQFIWHQIEGVSEVRFNFDYWQQNTPRRSTYPACRAVIAAEHLQAGTAAKMTSAIQQAYYQQAKNPSDTETLTDCAAAIGLNADQFSALLSSEMIDKKLRQDLRQAQLLNANGFPTILLAKEDTTYRLSNGYCSWQELSPRLKKLLN